MLDFDLVVHQAECGKDKIVVELKYGDVSLHLAAVLDPYPATKYTDTESPQWNIERRSGRVDLAEYLTIIPLQFYLANGSRLAASQIFDPADEDSTFDSANQICDIDWDACDVDIECEFGDGNTCAQSIHDWLRNHLAKSDAEIVFYDHRSGECADYLTVEHGPNCTPVVSLYHCKASGASRPGDRVGDLYEVCGQAIKSTKWSMKKRLRDHVNNRRKSGSKFVKGDWAGFEEYLDSIVPYEISLQIFVVQPGVSKSGLSHKSAELLGVTSRGLVASGCRPLIVIASR